MDGLIRVYTQRRSSSTLRYGRGIQGRSRDHVHDQVRVLRVWDENLGYRLTSRPFVTIVTHHADHFIRIGTLLIVKDQVTSNRALIPPPVSRELLVDDHHTASVSVVTVRELASSCHGKA